jgi:hypothetical protein
MFHVAITCASHFHAYATSMNKSASSLAKLRWAKTTPEQRTENAKKMAAASAKVRSAKAKKKRVDK